MAGKHEESQEVEDGAIEKPTRFSISEAGICTKLTKCFFEGEGRRCLAGTCEKCRAIDNIQNMRPYEEKAFQELIHINEIKKKLKEGTLPGDLSQEERVCLVNATSNINYMNFTIKHGPSPIDSLEAEAIREVRTNDDMDTNSIAGLYMSTPSVRNKDRRSVGVRNAETIIYQREENPIAATVLHTEEPVSPIAGVITTTVSAAATKSHLKKKKVPSASNKVKSYSSSSSDESIDSNTKDIKGGSFYIVPKKITTREEYDKSHPLVHTATNKLTAVYADTKFEEKFIGNNLLDFRIFHRRFENHCFTYYANDRRRWLIEFKKCIEEHQVLNRLLKGINQQDLTYADLRFCIVDYYTTCVPKDTQKSDKKLFKELKMESDELPGVYACIVEHHYRKAYPLEINTTKMHIDLVNKFIKSVPKGFQLVLQRERDYKIKEHNQRDTWPLFKSKLHTIYGEYINRESSISTKSTGSNQKVPVVTVKQEVSGGSKGPWNSRGSGCGRGYFQKRGGNSNSPKGGPTTPEPKPEEVKPKKYPVCSNCHFGGHTREFCYRLHLIDRCYNCGSKEHRKGDCDVSVGSTYFCFYGNKFYKYYWNGAHYKYICLGRQVRPSTESRGNTISQQTKVPTSTKQPIEPNIKLPSNRYELLRDQIKSKADRPVSNPSSKVTTEQQTENRHSKTKKKVNKDVNQIKVSLESLKNMGKHHLVEVERLIDEANENDSTDLVGRLHKHHQVFNKCESLLSKYLSKDLPTISVHRRQIIAHANACSKFIRCYRRRLIQLGFEVKVLNYKVPHQTAHTSIYDDHHMPTELGEINRVVTQAVVNNMTSPIEKPIVLTGEPADCRNPTLMEEDIAGILAYYNMHCLERDSLIGMKETSSEKYRVLEQVIIASIKKYRNYLAKQLTSVLNLSVADEQENWKQVCEKNIIKFQNEQSNLIANCQNDNLVISRLTDWMLAKQYIDDELKEKIVDEVSQPFVVSTGDRRSPHLEQKRQIFIIKHQLQLSAVYEEIRTWIDNYAILCAEFLNYLKGCELKSNDLASDIAYEKRQAELQLEKFQRDVIEIRRAMGVENIPYSETVERLNDSDLQQQEWWNARALQASAKRSLCGLEFVQDEANITLRDHEYVQKALNIICPANIEVYSSTATCRLTTLSLPAECEKFEPPVKWELSASVDECDAMRPLKIILPPTELHYKGIPNIPENALSTVDRPAVMRCIISIDGIDYPTLIDTGAYVCSLQRRIVEKHKLPWRSHIAEDSVTKTKGVAGEKPTEGFAFLTPILHNLRFSPIECKIENNSDPSYDIILGSHFLNKHGLTISPGFGSISQVDNNGCEIWALWVNAEKRMSRFTSRKMKCYVTLSADQFKQHQWETTCQAHVKVESRSADGKIEVLPNVAIENNLVTFISYNESIQRVFNLNRPTLKLNFDIAAEWGSPLQCKEFDIGWIATDEELQLQNNSEIYNSIKIDTAWENGQELIIDEQLEKNITDDVFEPAKVWTRDSLLSIADIGTSDLGIRKKMEDLIWKNVEIFATSPNVGVSKLREMTIEVTDETPISSRNYRIGPEVLKEIERQAKEMEEAGIVEPSISQWSSPIVPIFKKRDKGDGAGNPGTMPPVRFCLDLRLPNLRMKVPDYELPEIDMILQDIADSKVFSLYDCQQGFFQCQLAPESRKYVAFMCGQRKLQFTRAVFGAKGSPLAFQRAMNEAFADLLQPIQLSGDLEPRKHLAIYVDDCAIFTADLQSHLEMTEKVFKVFRDMELKVKISKCEIMKDQVMLLGHKISSSGIQVNFKSVKVVQDFPRPIKVVDMLKFVGVLTWQMKFLKNLATVIAPLTDVISSKKEVMRSKIKWTPAMLQAFEDAKKLVIADIKLATVVKEDPDKGNGPLILACDSSLVAAGSALLQLQGGIMRTIGFHSCKYNSSQKLYSCTDREMVSLRIAVRHWSPYLQGRNVEFQVDHKSLIYLNKMKIRSTRLARTLEELSNYQYTFKFVPGKEHITPDCLSRLNEDSLTSVKHMEFDPDYLPVGLEKKYRSSDGSSALFETLWEIKNLLNKTTCDIVDMVETHFVVNLKNHVSHVYNMLNKDKTSRVEFKRNILSQSSEAFQYDIIFGFCDLFKCKINVFYGAEEPITFSPLNYETSEEKLKSFNIHLSQKSCCSIVEWSNPNTFTVEKHMVGIADEQCKDASLRTEKIICPDMHQVSCPTDDWPSYRRDCKHLGIAIPLIQCFIHDVKACSILDTGASYTVISTEIRDDLLQRKLVKHAGECEMEISCSGDLMLCGKRDMCDIDITIGPVTFMNIRALVIDNLSTCLIIGSDILNRLTFELDYSTWMVRFADRRIARMGVFLKSAVKEQQECRLIAEVRHEESTPKIQMPDVQPPPEDIAVYLPDDIDEDDLFDMQQNDIEICDIIAKVVESKSGVLKIRESTYVLQDDILCNKDKKGNIVPVISFDRMVQIVCSMHKMNGHLGRNQTLYMIRKLFYHFKMYMIVRDITTTCLKCQLAKSIGQKTPPYRRVQMSYPFEMLEVDLISMVNHNGFHYIITAIDCFTKWSQCRCIRDKKGSTVANALRDILAGLVAIPSIVYSDNGSEWVSTEIAGLMQEFNIKHITSTAYSPTSHGNVERQNSVFQKLLRLSLDDDLKWTPLIPRICVIYNNSYHHTINCSPAQKLIDNSNLLTFKAKTPCRETKYWKLGNPKFVPYEEGQMVIKKIFRMGNMSKYKLLDRWTGPHVITKVLEHDVSYLIKDLATNEEHRVHYQQIRKFRPVPNYLTNNKAYRRYFEKVPDEEIGRETNEEMDVDSLDIASDNEISDKEWKWPSDKALFIYGPELRDAETQTEAFVLKKKPVKIKKKDDLENFMHFLDATVMSGGETPSPSHTRKYLEDVNETICNNKFDRLSLDIEGDDSLENYCNIVAENYRL